jgi:hypothetical protein
LQKQTTNIIFITFPDSIVSGDNKVYYKGSEVVTIGKLKDFSEQPENEGAARSMNVMIADISGFGREEHKYRVGGLPLLKGNFNETQFTGVSREYAPPPSAYVENFL